MLNIKAIINLVSWKLNFFLTFIIMCKLRKTKPNLQNIKLIIIYKYVFRKPK